MLKYGPHNFCGRLDKMMRFLQFFDVAFNISCLHFYLRKVLFKGDIYFDLLELLLYFTIAN